MARRPLILLGNDDGIEAPGLRALERALAALGEVWTVAPSEERSAAGQSLTLRGPIFIHPAGPRRFAVSGTPADAVFLAFGHLCPRKPALVVSGINNGPNLGTDTFYSGTVAVAREGAMRGVPSLAVSLAEGHGYTGAAAVAAKLAARLLAVPAARAAHDGLGLLLNVNVPAHPHGRPRLARLGRRIYPEDVHVRESPRGGTYAWIGGYPVDHDAGPGTDIRAVAEGYVSLTPLSLDLTQTEEASPLAALARELAQPAPGEENRP